MYPSMGRFTSHCLFLHSPLGEEEPEPLSHSTSECRAQASGSGFYPACCGVFPAPLCLCFPGTHQVGQGLVGHCQRRVCGNLGADSQVYTLKLLLSGSLKKRSPACTTSALHSPLLSGHLLGTLSALCVSLADLGLASPHESKMAPGRGLISPRLGPGEGIQPFFLFFQSV